MSDMAKFKNKLNKLSQSAYNKTNAFLQKKNLPNLTSRNSPGVTLGGDFDFYVNIEYNLEPISNRKSTTLPIGGVIVVSAYLNAMEYKQNHSLPIKTTWYRVFNNQKLLLPLIKSNAYQTNADDVGSSIYVEVSVCDLDIETVQFVHQTCFANIGSFGIEPTLCRTIDSYILSKSAKFQAFFNIENTDSLTTERDIGFDLTINITEKSLNFILSSFNHYKELENMFPELNGGYVDDCYSHQQQQSSTLSINYSMEENKSYITPSCIVSSLDVRRLSFVFSQGSIMHLTFLSRLNRDTCAICLRTMFGLQMIKTETIYHHCVSINPVTNLPLFHKGECDIPIIEILPNLYTTNRDNIELKLSVDRLRKITENAIKEKNALSTQLTDTINSYTEVINDLSKHYQEHRHSEIDTIIPPPPPMDNNHVRSLSQMTSLPNDVYTLPNTVQDLSNSSIEQQPPPPMLYSHHRTSSRASSIYECEDDYLRKIQKLKESLFATKNELGSVYEDKMVIEERNRILEEELNHCYSEIEILKEKIRRLVQME